MVPSVTLENSLDLVGDPIVSRVEQNAAAGEFTRQHFRIPSDGEAHWRSVAHEGDPVLRYPSVEQATKLILAKHLEAVDVPSPQIGHRQQNSQQARTALPRSDQALGMK